MEELTGLDARFLYSETRAAHMHTLKIIVMDMSARTDELTTSEFVARVEARLDRLPVLRRRAVPVPYGLGHPVWVEEPGFDITRQVHWRYVGARARTATWPPSWPRWPPSSCRGTDPCGTSPWSRAWRASRSRS